MFRGYNMSIIKVDGKYEVIDNNDNSTGKSRRSSDHGNPVTFLIGLAVLSAGVYLILQNTVISTHFSLFDMLGFNPPFGLVLLPFLIGVGILFFNSRSVLGWLLLIFGMVSILLGILMGLKIYFRPITLYEGLLMFGMTAAGTGVILKSFFGNR